MAEGWVRKWCGIGIGDNPTRVVDCGKYNDWQERSSMKRLSNLRVFFWSIAISGILNGFLLSSAFIDSAGGKKSLYVRLADLVAAPPGYIANQMFAPKEHTAGAFIAAAIASLVFSIFFYTVVSWMILRVLQLLQSVRTSTR